MYNNQRGIPIAEQKEIMLHILEEVDRYCSEHGIRYYLTYGTLLGAVRHKGFIPWDDDIDIVMNRRDFERFCLHFNDGRTDSLRLMSIDNTEGYYLLPAKVCDTGTVLIENVQNPIELGVYIDIFINDYLSDDLKEAKKLVHANKRSFKMLRVLSIADREGRAGYKQAILKVLRLAAKHIDVKKRLKRVEKRSRKFEQVETSVYCGSVTSLFYGEKEITETIWWGDGVKLSFEGRQFTVPSDYPSVLKAFYGDYMKLPPVEQQVTHHEHKVYWRER